MILNESQQVFDELLLYGLTLVEFGLLGRIRINDDAAVEERLDLALVSPRDIGDTEPPLRLNHLLVLGLLPPLGDALGALPDGHAV